MEIADYQDVLLTLAEIAITLIGFSGIVAVFGNRSVSRWSAEEALQLYALIAPSFTVLVGSFIPILVGTLVADPAVVWRISCAITGLFIVLTFGYFLANPHRARMTTGHKVNATLGSFVILALFLAALAVLPWYAFIYMFSLIWQIYIGCHNFILLFGWNTKGRNTDQ